MMKKELFLILILLPVISCHREKPVEIGFLLPNLTDSRYPIDCHYFTEQVRKLGGTVVTGDAGNDDAKQSQQAQKMIRNGVNLLVICAVNQYLSASIVRLAHDQGIKVIAYDRLIQNAGPDYFIGFDHTTVGRQQASYAVKRKPSGNYVMIEGDKGDKNAELIEQGQMQILQPYLERGKIQILFNVYVENWSAVEAYQYMKKVLELSCRKVDVVLSANDGMARGVIRALNEIQPGYPCIVTGLDADVQACRNIQAGKQTMTVYKPFRKLAEKAAILAMHLVRGEAVEKPDGSIFNGAVHVPTYFLKSVCVDRSNLRNLVNQDRILQKSLNLNLTDSLGL